MSASGSCPHRPEQQKKRSATSKISTCGSRHGLNWPASYCRHNIDATGALGEARSSEPGQTQSKQRQQAERDKTKTPHQRRSSKTTNTARNRPGQDNTPSHGTPHEATDKATRQASAAGKQANKRATDTPTKQAGRQQHRQAQAGRPAASKQAGGQAGM